MARIRSVKPEFWADQGLARLDRDARLLYIALWNFADEHGRLHGDPRFIKGQVFPYDDDLTMGKVTKLLDALASAGKVVRYAVDGDEYLYLPKLAQHQRLETDKVASRLPGPDESTPLSEPGADKPAPDADSSTLLYGAGSREQVAGTPAPTGVGDDDFDAFWAAYPRKVGRDAARRAFKAKCRSAPAAVIVAAAVRFAADPNLPQATFIPHPTTWLNRGGWHDDPQPAPQGRTNGHGPPRESSEDRMFREAREERERKLAGKAS